MNKFVKTSLVLAGVSAAIMALVGCTAEKNSIEDDVKSEVVTTQIQTNGKLPIVTIKVKDFGEIKLELYADKAPKTVANFAKLVNEGFYDGLTFHRIIKDFMSQGGCPLGNGTGGADYNIKGEFSQNGFKQNDLKHTVGVISMARAIDKDSASSQFFIVAKDSPHLDGLYAAFGKVIEGLDIVEAINSVKTNPMDAPLESVIIEEITVDTQGIEYPVPEKIK